MGYRMLVLTDFDESASNVERCGTNKPEERQRRIYEKLSSDGAKYRIQSTPNHLTKRELTLLGIHREDYIDFLEGAYDSFISNEDSDYILRSDGIVPDHFSKGKSYQSYNKLVLWRQMGHYCDDVFTPINGDTFKTSMRSANNCFVAAAAIESNDRIYCLNTYPGHHARRDGYSGYCYINNAYVCASVLLLKGYSVAILDLDYHAGTHEIFPNNGNLLSISIHADPKYEYPSFSGHEDENTKYNHNIIFPKRATWDQYKVLIGRALALIRDFNPDIVIVPFGGDTYKDDPDASDLYGCNLELEDYIKMGNMVSSLGKRVIVTQEGGYCMDKIADIVDNFLAGLCN
jgi:acetoin utilization deacetylase AcuC-like enzyme